MNNLQDLVSLGKTDIKITTVGVGAWAWGDRMIWGYGAVSYTHLTLPTNREV